VARAVSDFILTTLARSSAQQATIAANAALGLALVVASLFRIGGDLAQVRAPRTAVLWMPLVLVYTAAIGVRAAFFVPSELAASWTFRFNAPIRSSGYWSATRAAAVGFLVPMSAVADLLIAPIIGIRAAAWHAVIVASVAVVLAETIALTVDFVPFTRPYQPGHAKLRTRWPLYLIGLFVFAVWPARASLSTGSDAVQVLRVAGWILGVAIALDIAGRLHARSWRLDPSEEFQDESAIAVLDIGIVLPNESGA
jgi:hypothetical protein